MTDQYSAGQQSGTPAMPPPPVGAPVQYPPPAYAQQPVRTSNKGLIIGIIVGVSAAVLVIVGILAAIAIPIFLQQREKANDAAAKADASSLGLLIATYYVDNDGPVPDIELEDGYYVVGGERSRYPASANVEMGGATGTNALDWCVWVTAPDGAEKTFQYSAFGGLSVGAC